jgi:hypothetical protein
MNEDTKNLNSALLEQLRIREKSNQLSQAAIDLETKFLESMKNEIDVKNQIETLDNQILKLKQLELETNDKSLKILIDQYSKVKGVLSLLDKKKDLSDKIKNNFLDTLGATEEMADIFKTGGLLYAGSEAFKNSASVIEDAFSTTFGTAFEMYKTMGISAKEGAILAGEIGKASFSMAGLLYGGEAMAESSKALVDQFGNVNMASSDMVEGVTEINALVGDAAKSVELALAFQNAGVAANDVDDVLKNIGSKTGVTATKIAKEMADNQFLMLGATKQELNLIAKHNAALVKQGTTRKQILESAQGVLDIESTINNANKLALLTGKQMNVSELMSAALAVDTAEGIKNKAEAEKNYADLLRKQVDSMGGIEGMSEINKRTLLETLKIDEERLISMYNANTAQENNNKLVEEGNAFIGGLTAGAISFGAGIGSATLELIKMIAQAMIFNKVMTGSFGMGNLKFGKFGGGGGDGDDVNPSDTSKTKGAGPAKAMGGINATSLLKGAAAMLVMAAALFVFAKAMQEMKNVGLSELGMAIASILVMAGGLVLLGKVAGEILIGAAAMLVMAAALFVFGKAIQEIAVGVGMLEKLPAIFTPLASLAGGLALFGLAMTPFSAGLIQLAAGLAILSPVLPQLLALVALGAGIALIANALNGGGSSETTTSNTKQSDPLLEEIKGLRADIKSQPINVVLNGKIVGEINKGSRAINSYVNK